MIIFQGSKHISKVSFSWRNTICSLRKNTSQFAPWSIFYIVFRFLFCFWLILPLCWSTLVSSLPISLFTQTPCVTSFGQMIFYTTQANDSHACITRLNFEWHASLSSYLADCTPEYELYQFKSPRWGSCCSLKPVLPVAVNETPVFMS